VVAGLALSASTITRAQTAEDYIVDQFGDDSTVGSWSRAWGLSPTFEWDAAENAPGNPAGALKVTIPFDILTCQGNDNQCAFQRQLPDVTDFELYTKIHFDIKLDPGSGSCR